MYAVITVEFEASAAKTPKKLAVVSDGKTIKANARAPDSANGVARCWTLDNQMLVVTLTVEFFFFDTLTAPFRCVTQDCDASLTFHVSYTTATDKKTFSKYLQDLLKNAR